LPHFWHTTPSVATTLSTLDFNVASRHTSPV
jgi:hypothetical protein